LNMAFAATFVDHAGGSRIWFPDEAHVVDVTETPDEIVEAMRTSGFHPSLHPRVEPRVFAFPLTRPGPRGH